MLWKNILVPHDFSPAARRALDLALDLAALTGGRVTLLHVSPIPHGLRVDSKIVPDGAAEPVRIDEYMTSAARRKLEEQLSGRPSAGILAVAAEEDPAGAILAHARSIGADVIFMGTHGRSGVRRLLVGSCAERVLRRAEVPVLVVRDPRDGGEETHLREEDTVHDEEGG